MNKFAILLTCCVKPLYLTKKDYKERKKLYLNVIDKWLNETSLEIYCVDSSNYDFKIKHPRFHMYSFMYKNKDADIGKTYGEVKSILNAYEYFKKQWKKDNLTYIIKITGRYYLESLEKWVKRKKYSNRDLWTQQEKDLPILHYLANFILGDWTNSEIFVCKISKLSNMFCKYDKSLVMERHLYNLTCKYNSSKLPPLKNTLKSKRGGDKLFLKYL